MSRTGIDDKLFVLDLEDKAVGLVDMHTPPSGEVALERFGLAYAAIAVSINALKKGIDALCHSGINLNDLAELFPSTVVPYLLHADSLRREDLGAGRRFGRLFFFSASAISRATSSSVCS